MPDVLNRHFAAADGLASERLKAKSRIYYGLRSEPFWDVSCEHSQASAPVYIDMSYESPLACFGPDFAVAKLKKMSQLNELYSDLDNRTTCVLLGTTGTITFSEAPSSPSAYPKFVSGYINQLQTVNRSLESRVENLEGVLAEVQKYLPTIKKLVHEYGSAAGRVSAVLTQLGRKYDPESAWKIAEKRDALQSPPPEDYSEIV